MILTRTAIAAVIRQGDYFLLESHKDGVHAQFSPAAAPGAPVVGAFASSRGVTLYWDADGVQGLLLQTANDFEACERQILRDVEIASAEEDKTEEAKGPVSAVSKHMVALITQYCEQGSGTVRRTVGDWCVLLGFPNTQYARQRLVEAWRAAAPHTIVEFTPGGRGRGNPPMLEVDLGEANLPETDVRF